MTTAGVTPPGRRQLTRARLLEAAFAVFAAQGYSGATVDAIVAAARCSKGAFYVHFASKEAVFLEVLWSRVRAEETRLCVVDERAAAQPLALLHALVAYLGPGDDPRWPVLLLECWSHSRRTVRVRDGVAAVARFRRAALRGALRAAVAAGIIRPVLPPEACADLLLTLGDGLISRAATGQAGTGTTDLPGIIAGVLGVALDPQPPAAVAGRSSKHGMVVAATSRG